MSERRTNPNIVFDTVQHDLPERERLLDSVQAAQDAGERMASTSNRVQLFPNYLA